MYAYHPYDHMHFGLHELASPSNPPLYPKIDINDDILSQSLSCFAKYVKSKYWLLHPIHLYIQTLI